MSDGRSEEIDYTEKNPEPRIIALMERKQVEGNDKMIRSVFQEIDMMMDCSSYWKWKKRLCVRRGCSRRWKLYFMYM